MKFEVDMSEINLWADAIATRIADEWSGSKGFIEDVAVLKDFIKTSIQKNPSCLNNIIGTGIIEEGFFDELD